MACSTPQTRASSPSSSTTFGPIVRKPDWSEQLLRLLDVRDPQLDVGVVQRLEDDLARAARQALHALGEVVDRDGGARVADVERLADGARQLERQEQRVDHIVDVAPSADLGAVAVNRQVLPGERRLDERPDRAAADLAGPVDVERMHGHRRERELVIVGVGHVLAGELRDGVGPACLADGADRRHLSLRHAKGMRPEDLARREVDEALDGRQGRDGRLEHVVGPDHVDTHRPDRALQHGRDARDRRRVDDVRGAVGELAHRVRVEDVGLVECEIGVLGEVGAAERVAVEVVDGDDLVRVDEPPRQRRPDEAGPAGDEDPFAGE
jgi:hypothetical protein